MKIRPDSDVEFICLHYSATPITQDTPLSLIRSWHKERGWAMEGYHIYVRLSGDREYGRPLEPKKGFWTQGAGVSGWNHNTIHVCYEGGVYASDPNTGLDTRTQAQKEEIVKIFKELLGRFPNAEIIGHRDMKGAATQCPGFNAALWWKQVQKEEEENKKPKKAFRRDAVAEFIGSIIGKILRR